MNSRYKAWKLTYYAIELLILILGGSLILFFSFDFAIQIMLLVITLLFYITFGLLRHQAEHDLDTRVVIEYILISAIILASFIFLNITRL